MKTSVTVVIPALNEEKLLESVVQDTLSAIGLRFDSYEIIIINDGSADRTGNIADRLALDNPSIKVIHHSFNRGLGFSVREGYDLAMKDYVIWNPSDHGMLGESLEAIFDQVGKAEIIIPYIANPEFRSFKRRFISRSYVTLMNSLFGLKLRYYNGPVMYQTSLVKTTKTATLGFAFFAELLILLIRAGHSYIEIPTYHRKRLHGESKAFRLNNFLDVFLTISKLVWDIRLKGMQKNKVSTVAKAV
jgi:glycosyltransferase involved in cell wall biosynthesis